MECDKITNWVSKCGIRTSNLDIRKFLSFPQITKSAIALLRYFNWKIFAILYESAWKPVADSLKLEASNYNDEKFKFNVSYFRSVENHYECCDKGLNCCSTSYWYDVLKETEAKTRSKRTFNDLLRDGGVVEGV